MLVYSIGSVTAFSSLHVYAELKATDKTVQMTTVKEQLNTVFTKIMAGTVTREEGAMLLNDCVKNSGAETIKELEYLLINPPQNVHKKTIFHTMVLARNKAFVPLMAITLDNPDEDLAIVAAQELSRLHTDEAQDVLIKHLDIDNYGARKASAEALARGFGQKGADILKEHVINNDVALIRLTSAEALLQAGSAGFKALIELIFCEKSGPSDSAVEVLTKAPGSLLSKEVRPLVDALMVAGDKDDTVAAIALLKIITSLGGLAGRYVDFVRVFEENASEAVRDEAGRTLASIRA